MYSICLIDDRYYGIPQVINAIPNNIEYEFFYYDRVASIEPRRYDLVLLDYFLDKDDLTGEDIYDTIDADCIIAFSSEDAMNDKLIQKWAKFKATKLKDTVRNPLLTSVIQSIL